MWGVPAPERVRCCTCWAAWTVRTRGQVLVEGKDIFRLKDDRLAVFRRRKIGFVFQSYNLVPSLNVWENIVLPIGLDGRKVDRDFVMDLVERIGMEDRLRALPGTLSGGQQQRGRHCQGAGVPAGYYTGGRAHRESGFPHGDRSGESSEKLCHRIRSDTGDDHP